MGSYVRRNWNSASSAAVHGPRTVLYTCSSIVAPMQ